MTETQDFSPEMKALHKHWLDSWHGKFHEGPYTPDDVAESMFHVALMVWASRHPGEATTAQRLYLLALNFAKRGGLDDPHETLAGVTENTPTSH